MKKILIGGFVVALSLGSLTALAEPLRGGTTQGVSYNDRADRGKGGPEHKKFLTSRHDDRARHGHRDRREYRDDRHHRSHRDHKGHRHHHGHDREWGHGYGWKGKHGWKHRKHAWKHRKHYHRHHGYRGHRHHHDRRFRYYFSYNAGDYSVRPGGYLSIDLAR